MRYGVAWYADKKRKHYVCEQFETIEKARRKAVRLHKFKKIPENVIQIFEVR